MAHPENPRSNHLLDALPDADRQRWRCHLERVDLSLGQVLFEPDRPQLHAYFPTSAIVSLQCLLRSGATSEIAVVGNEGVVGTSLFLGGATTITHCAVLVEGQGYRVEAQVVRDEFDQFDSVRRLFLRYTQALLTQIAQAAVCNRHHTIDQQVCGWLLHSLDRLLGAEVVVTQELLASMLGVRREGVTEAALKLQKAGLIRYARGHITALDRPGLEARSCECYAVVKKEYDRLLPQGPAERPATPRRWAWPASVSVALAAV